MKKCCKDFLKDLLPIYEDRSFEFQCPNCGKRTYQKTSADGGLNYKGQTPEDIMSEEIITNAIEGKFGKKIQDVGLTSLKKAASLGKNIKIKIWDRYQ